MSIPRFEKFVYDITEIDLHWHRLSSGVMKQYGLKGSCSIYLIKLHGCPEGMTAAQLGTSCGKDKADVSRDIAALEKAGYVRRECAGGSAYRARIFLTERGRALTEEVIRSATQVVELVGQDFTDDDRAVFYRMLDGITDNLRALSERGLPEE